MPRQAGIQPLFDVSQLNSRKGASSFCDGAPRVGSPSGEPWPLCPRSRGCSSTQYCTKREMRAQLTQPNQTKIYDRTLNLLSGLMILSRGLADEPVCSEHISLCPLRDSLRVFSLPVPPPLGFADNSDPPMAVLS